MSSRFGAAAPSKKNTKLKMLLGSMLFLLLIVLLVLIWVVQNNTIGSTSTLPEVQTPIQVQQDSGNVGILVPLFRIEKGQPVSEEMFKTSFIPENQVPMGAMLASSKATLTEKYAANLINANVPLMKADISDSQPLESLIIPVGFRLITILLDSQSGVDGWAKPGTRVDVNWTFMKDGEKQLASPLVRFVKVISVGGDSGAQNKEQRTTYVDGKKLTVSLLVTERQSQFIEVAKGNGELSLVLVGGSEPPPNVDDPPVILKAGSIIGENRTKEVTPEVQPDGVMYSTDPLTGRKTKYILVNGRWNKDNTYSE
jgi:Flp pilus assembly protein CpaB